MATSANPLTVVFYGGPGTGKSTTAAHTFAKLKSAGRNAELVHEFAKDLTWAKHWDRLKHQPSIAAEQMWRMDVLRDKVEVIVADSSPLLCCIYGTAPPKSFRDWLVADERNRNTLNIFLQRSPERGFNQHGRTQTQDEAEALDTRIQQFLIDHGVPYTSVPLDPNGFGYVDEVVAKVDDLLG